MDNQARRPGNAAAFAKYAALAVVAGVLVWLTVTLTYGYLDDQQEQREVERIVATEKARRASKLNRSPNE